MSREFTKAVNQQLSQMAEELGYKKQKTRFIMPFNEACEFTLGFSLATRQIKGHALVCPQVGIYYKSIDNIIHLTTGNSYDSTIYLALGYTMPLNNWYEYDFVEGQENSSQLNQMKKDIITYGQAFCKKLGTLEGLLAYYEIEGRNDNGFKYYHLPILYYLIGEKAKGSHIIDNRIAENKRKGLADSITTRETDDGVCHATTINVYRYDKEYEDFGERFKQLPGIYNPDDWKYE